MPVARIEWKIVSALILAVAITFNTNSAVRAQGQSAMALYNAGKYSQALTAFEAMARKNPTDDTAHYYIGLCCQSLHQNTRAAAEYRWVASASRNAQLKQMAQKGYDSLAKYSTVQTNQSTQGLPLSSPAARERAMQASQWAASASFFRHQNPSSSNEKRVKKVIEFYTTWCHVCSEFAETFEKTKARYSGRVEFEQLNAEDPANAEARARYNVTRFPTLIYLDANGTVLKRGEGAPMGPNFGNIIESL